MFESVATIWSLFLRSYLFGPANHRRESHIFLILFGVSTTPHFRNVSLIHITHIFTKHHSSLLCIYTLARGSGIHIKDPQEIVGSIHICFAKNKAIINKKQVVDLRSPLTNSNLHKTFVDHSLSQKVNQPFGAQQKEIGR